MLKLSGTIFWRLGQRATLVKYSSTSTYTVLSDKIEASRSVTGNTSKNYNEENSGLVAAAFAALNSPEPPPGQKKRSPKSVSLNRVQQIDNMIEKAEDIDGLLKVAEMPVVSRRHALKMVSVLSEWSSESKVKMTEFEKDPRFLKLCRILARTPAGQAMHSVMMADDLSTVLGITGDDEAARLISNLTLPQLVKVIKSLHMKGRRSTPLLRALSHNIVRQSEVIDLKKSADLLFSMAALNFPDPVLLDRICHDVTTQLPSNEDKPAVVKSIAVSLGLMRYRHEACLDGVARWLRGRRAAARLADLAAATHTFATLHYEPLDADELLKTVETIREEDLPRSSAWLELVFSLLLLRRASTAQLSSTLQPQFVEKLLSLGEISIPSRRKLMQIDAYVALSNPDYDGPRLPEDIAVGVPVVYTKEKMAYVQSVMDTFKNLISSDNFIKKGCNSEMGFLYDGEFAVDSKCNPVPLEKAANDKSVFRIAVLTLDYHDLCRKVPAPLGHIQLYTRLLEMKGYKVLQIPYTEFNPKDKLITRVQYIEKRLKQIVSQATDTQA